MKKVVHPTKAYFFDFHNKTTFDRIYRIDPAEDGAGRIFRSLRKSDMKDSSALRRVNAGEVQTLPAIPARAHRRQAKAANSARCSG